jgi:hypothetical protein
LVFGNGKNWQGSAQLSLLSPSPQPSEFCNDENNSVIRLAMDALRNSKKISLLAVAILFLFTFFKFILDAPLSIPFTHIQEQKLSIFTNLNTNFIDSGSKCLGSKENSCIKLISEYYKPGPPPPPPNIIVVASQ